jgi:hypothetical protein
MPRRAVVPQRPNIAREVREVKGWLLAAGCWLLAAGCWLLAAGCWLLAAPNFV